MNLRLKLITSAIACNPIITLVRVNPTVNKICSIYTGSIIVNTTPKLIATLVSGKLENTIIEGIVYPAVETKEEFVFKTKEDVKEFCFLLDLSTDVEYFILSLFKKCNCTSFYLKLTYQGNGLSFKIINIDIQNRLCLESRKQVQIKKKVKFQVNMEQYELKVLGLK